MITFDASLEGKTIFKADDEGEAKITLTVPASDLEKVVPLLGMSRRLLKVSITEVE